MAQILTIAKKVAGALDSKVKVPVLDAELKLPPEVLRIVGAMATGAVIENGENANGKYVKYADGTMICTKIFASDHAPIPITDVVGTMYWSPQTMWTFPHAFYNIQRTTHCSGVYSAEQHYNHIIGITYAGTSGACYYNFLAPISITLASDIFFGLSAIGRWKA